MDPIVDEGFYREMMEYFLDRNIRRIKKMVVNGADVIEMAGHLVSSIVGPTFAKEYAMDYENRLVWAIHEMGALVIFHNCGDAAKVMHLYNDLDIDCWGYLTPPPFGDVDLEHASKPPWNPLNQWKYPPTIGQEKVTAPPRASTAKCARVVR